MPHKNVGKEFGIHEHYNVHIFQKTYQLRNIDMTFIIGKEKISSFYKNCLFQKKTHTYKQISLYVCVVVSF
jgi:hypothetical protein